MANMNAIQVGNLVRAFYQTGTADQIAERTGYNINTVYRYIRAWHDMKIIFRSDWKRSHLSGRTAPVWELRSCASQHDAPRPAPKTPKQRAADYHQRKVEERAQELFADMKAKDAANRARRAA